MNLAQTERTALCDLLLETGPDAPTLCEGWTTADLAAHLIVRENDPIGAFGILIEPLSALTDKRMAEVHARDDWPGTIERLRQGPARFSVFRIPGVDEGANAVEFFVHHEDVRRAATPPAPPRELDAETEEFFWKRLKLLGRAFFRKVDVGVALERPGGRPEDALRVHPGQRVVTIVGHPSELLLFANGRRAAAHVEFIGEDNAIAAVLDGQLAV